MDQPPSFDASIRANDKASTAIKATKQRTAAAALYDDCDPIEIKLISQCPPHERTCPDYTVTVGIMSMQPQMSAATAAAT